MDKNILRVRFHPPPFVQSCSPRGWRILGDQYIGSGVEGDVYRACLKDNCDFVAKVIHAEPEDLPALYEQKRLMYELGQENLAPRLQTALLCRDFKKLTSVIEHFTEFQKHREFRDQEILDNIRFLRKRALRTDLEHAEVLANRLKSPLYSVLFSSYMPKTDKQQDSKYEKPIRAAIEQLLIKLAQLGIAYDQMSSDNIRVYQNAQGQWIAKLVDVGHTQKILNVPDLKEIRRTARQIWQEL
jgi:hypothetical protein